MEKSEVTKKETVYSKIELKNDKELDEMSLELDEEYMSQMPPTE